MIVVDLVCSGGHRFEGWFSSHDDMETQSSAGALTCPVCNAKEIKRVPSAPYVARMTVAHPKSQQPQNSVQAVKSPESNKVAQATETEAQVKLFIDALREHAAKAENVGTRFAEEARKIHYGDAEERAIRGVATPQDAASLINEGITVLPVPPEKKDLH